MQGLLHHSLRTCTIYAIPFKKMFQTRTPNGSWTIDSTIKTTSSEKVSAQTSLNILFSSSPASSFPAVQNKDPSQLTELLFNLVLEILTTAVKIQRYIKGRKSRRGLLFSNDRITQKAQRVSKDKWELKESSAELPERHQYIKINSFLLYHQK